MCARCLINAISSETYRGIVQGFEEVWCMLTLSNRSKLLTGKVHRAIVHTGEVRIWLHARLDHSSISSVVNELNIQFQLIGRPCS